jgi:hypothetical protein
MSQIFTSCDYKSLIKSLFLFTAVNRWQLKCFATQQIISWKQRKPIRLHGLYLYEANDLPAYRFKYLYHTIPTDCLCGLVVEVLGYRFKGPGFDSRRHQIFWDVVGLERGPLSLVGIIEELLEWKRRGSGSRKPRLMAVGIHCADNAAHSIRNSWQF